MSMKQLIKKISLMRIPSVHKKTNNFHMKTTFQIKLIAILISVIVNCSLLFASGGDDHTHGDEKSTATGQEQKYFSSEAVSDKYELLLRYESIHIGEPAHLTLFVSDYATNKPINKAELKITAQEDSQLVFTTTQTGEGTYTIEATFPEKKKYSLAVSINSELGADLILLSNIEACKELPHEETANSKSSFAKTKHKNRQKHYCCFSSGCKLPVACCSIKRSRRSR